MKLSRREQFLLGLLVIVVVIFGGYKFLVIPSYNKYNERVAERERLEFEKSNALTMLDIGDRMIEDFDELEAEFNEITKKYRFLLSSNTIDKIVTSMSTDSGLEAVKLNISDVKNPFPGELNEEGVEIEPTSFYTITTTMNLKGNYDALKKLFSRLYIDDYIRLKSLTFSDEAIPGTVGSPNVAVTFEVDMLNKEYPAFNLK